MDILIAILVFLGCISGGDQISDENLEQLKNQHNSQIEMLRTDWDTQEWE